MRLEHHSIVLENLNMYENIHIETDRLEIRNFHKSDIETLLRIVNDEEIMKFVPFTQAKSLMECNELMERIIRRYSESAKECFKGFLLLAISRETAEPVGFAGFYPATYDITQNELFYGVFSDCRGNGYAIEIGKAVINFGFSQVGTSKIIATVDESNSISRRIVEKLGMKFESIIEDEAAKDSSYEGELLYSITSYVF
jgi:ribosomal-protein-alanine N-acetyltransferase